MLGGAALNWALKSPSPLDTGRRRDRFTPAAGALFVTPQRGRQLRRPYPAPPNSLSKPTRAPKTIPVTTTKAAKYQMRFMRGITRARPDGSQGQAPRPVW